MKRLALLVGVSTYQPGLNPLPSAERDVQELHRVLLSSDIGNFDQVTPLINPDPMVMQEAIESLFRDRDRDDLVFLFFSGHGIKDDRGKIYFATRLTQKTPRGELVKASAVPASFIHEIMGNSQSRRQVVVLDCCFSGAFAEGMIAKDDGRVAVLEQLGGEGRAVLTSSTSTQYSFEQAGADLSIYTRYIIEGMETGAADEDNDGMITIDELHDYAKRRVQESAPAMRPEIQTSKEGFRIKLARALVGDPKLRYRREVARFAERGDISDIARMALNSRYQTLGLRLEEAEAIEAEVLKPSRTYHTNLKLYERQYRDVLQQMFPLTETVRSDLDYLKQSLGLRDEDVIPIETSLEASRTYPPEPVHLPVSIVPSPQSKLPPPTPPPPFSRILKGILAASAVVLISSAGLYGYRQWQGAYRAQEFLEQSISLANDGRWAEAIAHATQIPPHTEASTQAQTYLEQWSIQLLKYAQERYGAGDIEEAIAQAQVIPSSCSLYQQAQGLILQWQNELKEDQDTMAEIQRVLGVWDTTTAQQLADQLHSSALQTQANALITDIDQRSDAVEQEKRLAEERRKLQQEREQLAAEQRQQDEIRTLLDRHPDPALSQNYRYAWLSQRPVQPSDLAGKSGTELTIMRNSIYARHGRIFQEPELVQAFSVEPWYRPTYTGNEFAQIARRVVTPQEEANAEEIWDYQEQTGLR